MIVNLTQHAASPEQRADGVVEPTDKKRVQALLTFDSPPSRSEIQDRASQLARIAESMVVGGPCRRAAMIGGAGYLMAALEAALLAARIAPLHSFTRREAVEKPGPDGTVEKTVLFKHVGWVDMGM